MARVGFVYSEELIKACDQLPRVKGRASLCAELIKAYGLIDEMMILEPKCLSMDELANFHSKDYLEAFKQLCDEDDPEKLDAELMEEYGLGYDCPVEEGLFERCSLIAGGSVAAAEALISKEVEIAINWCGGWHHAKRFEAAGFCYINDIVLAAQKLRERFDRILYVDLDLHHGDGVEEAFYSTDRVFTFSIHKLSPGFYPGTGRIQDIGDGKGSYHCLNIPLKDGLSTAAFVDIFKPLLSRIIRSYDPMCVICQCGADGLAMDEMDSFNLSSRAYTDCIQHVLDLRLPTLLLGGGGYHHANTVRTWTLLTACALSKQLPEDIPNDLESFMRYKPDFELSVPAGNRPDDNKAADVERLLNVARGCINQLPKLEIELER